MSEQLSDEINSDDFDQVRAEILGSFDGQTTGSPQTDSIAVKPPEIRFGYDHLLVGVGAVAAKIPKIYYVNR